jgi:hypothetical protein
MPLLWPRLEQRGVPLRLPLLACLGASTWALVILSSACAGDPFSLDGSQDDLKGEDAGRAYAPPEVDSSSGLVDRPAILPRGAIEGGDARIDGASCANDLSNIGTGNFRISFNFTTAQSGLVALLNQRAVCGFSPFWDIRLKDGRLQVETCEDANATQYAQVMSTGALLNDNRQHTIVVERVMQTLVIVIDGAMSGSSRAEASLGPLPPLAAGNDTCTQVVDDEGATTANDNVVLMGSISDVCIARGGI